MTESGPSHAMDDVWQYPLFEALYGRRSRRFGLGFEITEGPFQYKSHERPVPLSEPEEALLVAAGGGVTGTPLWDMAGRSRGEWQTDGPMAARPPAVGGRRCSSRLCHRCRRGCRRESQRRRNGGREREDP